MTLKPTYDQLLKENKKLQDQIYNKSVFHEAMFLENVIQSNSEISIVTIDIDLNLMFINKKAEEVFGYKAKDLIGKNLTELHSIEKVEFSRILNAIKVVKEVGRYEYFFEENIVNKKKYYKSVVNGVWDDKKELIGYVLFTTDITEEKEIKEELENEKNFFEKILDTSNAIIVGLDHNHIIKFFNSGAEKITGYKKSEVVGKDWFEIFFTADMLEEMNSVWKDAFGVLSHSYKNEIITKTKEKRIISWQSRGIYDDEDISKHQVFSFGIDVTNLINAQKIIKNEGERFKALIENSIDVISVIDKDGKSIFRSPSFERILGYKPEERKGFDAFNDVIPEDKNHLQQQFIKALGNYGAIEKISFRAKHKNGSIRYLEGTAKNMLNSPFINGIVANYRDITDKKKAQIEIEKQNIKLRIAQESAEVNLAKLNEAQRIAHLGYWELDLVNNTLTWSDEIYRIFDLKPQEFDATYEAFLDNIHPEDRDRVNKAYTDSLKNKTPYKIEHRLLLKNDKIKYVVEQCNTKFDENGNPLHSFGTVLDITEIKTTELKLLEAIQKSEENELKYRLLYEKSPLGIFIAKPDGIIIDINQTALDILGSPSKEATKKINVLKFPPLVKNGYSSKFLKCVSTGKIISFEIQYKSKWGKEDYLSSYIIPLKNNLGIVENIYTIIEIITIRKETERALKKSNDEYYSLNEEYKIQNEALILARDKAEESDRLKSEFINNMSHEIKTPMNGILGFSELINDSNLSKDKIKQYTKVIKNSGNQLMRIIDDILEISKLETKQVKSIEKELCLNDLMLQEFSIFDIKAKEKRIPLYLKNGLSDKKSLILSDSIKLSKVLSNLLENALKFTNEGFIEFGYNLIKNIDDFYIQIFVKDTGIGIQAKNQKLIFERFSQEEKELSKKAGGLGLGLSIAKENTELLGGNIVVESEKGNGSTFYVEIPYKPVNIADVNLTNSLQYAENQYNNLLLIVEDEEINYLYLDTIIRKIDSNITVLHAKNGKEAVDICMKNTEIDLVFMDLKMPIMNGFEAASRIKKIHPNLPIIAQTAYSTKEEKKQALENGCDGFISKPLDKKIIVETVTKYLKINL